MASRNTCGDTLLNNTGLGSGGTVSALLNVSAVGECCDQCHTNYHDECVGCKSCGVVSAPPEDNVIEMVPFLDRDLRRDTSRCGNSPTQLRHFQSYHSTLTGKQPHFSSCWWSEAFTAASRATRFAVSGRPRLQPGHRGAVALSCQQRTAAVTGQQLPFARSRDRRELHLCLFECHMCYYQGFHEQNRDSIPHDRGFNLDGDAE